MSMPSIGRSSLSCWKPISASPRATTADALAQDLPALCHDGLAVLEAREDLG